MKKCANENQIGVMSVVHEGRKPFGMQTYFFEDMVKSIDLDKSKIFFFSPIDWRYGVIEVPGYNFIGNRWVKTKSTIPEIIYDRAFSKDEGQKLHMESFRNYLKESNRNILNPFELAELLNNKIEFHAFLQNHNIPTLCTFPFRAIKDSGFFDRIDASKVYVKPTFGSKGEGIFVIEKREETYLLFDHLGGVESFQDYLLLIAKLESEIQYQDRYFIQEEAKIELFEDSPFDIRVLVQNYGDDYIVTGKAVRIGKKFSMTSNLNSGGNAMPIEELDYFFHKEYMYSLEELHLNIEKLCLDCSEVLRREIGNFCEIGFDILITKDKGPIIIEGNAKPSRWVFVQIADYLESMGKNNSYYIDRRRETVSVPIIYASYLLKTK